MTKKQIEEIVRDINEFYSYFDVVRGISHILAPTAVEIRMAYQKMSEIRSRYPTNAVLANKLDEATGYL